MYFSADAGDGYHIWRQRFPHGPPEQITSGPTEEEGLAITPDGKALITSVGLTQRSVWVQDPSGERQISLEGYGFFPLLSADGRKVFFRITRGVGMGQSPSELWVADVSSGQKQRLFPGQLVTTYDVSANDRVVAAVVESDGQTAIWLTGLDGREAARRIPNGNGHSPRFGRDGQILFRAVEANRAFLYRIREDGTGRQQFAEARGSVVGPGSPDGEWVGVSGSAGLTLYSTSGRPPIVVFPSQLTARLRWSVDGKYVYLSIQYGQASAFAFGRTYALPLVPGSGLPSIPPGGFRTEADVAAVPGARVLPYGDVGPGPSPATYAFSRVTSARNLYRIPLE
jgi:hypothetical protein